MIYLISPEMFHQWRIVFERSYGAVLVHDDDREDDDHDYAMHCSFQNNMSYNHLNHVTTKTNKQTNIANHYVFSPKNGFQKE